jgi:hypothetical protein
MDISPFIQLGEAVLPNVFPKLIQLHQQIRFTSTATAEAATATAVPNAPFVFLDFQ